MWMAGGGVKGGTILGSTDEIGLNAVTDRTTQMTSMPPSFTSWGLITNNSHFCITVGTSD